MTNRQATDNSAITAFPLAWPPQWPRTPSSKRKPARFGKRDHRRWRVPLNAPEASDRILDELYAMKKNSLQRVPSSSIVISTNIALRLDGLPRARQKAPDDVGAAIYFTLDGVPHCLPCDRWDDVAGNLAAIAAHIKALRGIERWGVGDLKAAFAGFKVLPEHSSGTPWHEVLGIAHTTDPGVILKAYRRKAQVTHPDRPTGSDKAFKQVNEAYRLGLADCDV